MLEKIKVEVIAMAQKAEKTGLCLSKSGNFSIKDETGKYFVITPSGIDREKLQVDDICVIGLNGELVESINSLKPSSEYLMHLSIYNVRKDIFSIAHTHSKMATSFAVVKKSIPAIVYEVASCGLNDGIIYCVPYGRPGTTDLSSKIAEYSKKGDILLMERHGVVAMSINSENALLRATYCEELAEIYFNALLLNNGKEPEVFSIEELHSWKYPNIKKS